MNENKIEIGDEVMFVDIKAHYIDPVNTPEVGERGIVVKRSLMKSGRFGWAVRWSQGEIIVCLTDSLTITEKGVAKAFKLGTFKRLDALLRAKPERLEKEIEIATENARNRVKQLEKCGCTSDTIARAREDLKKLEDMKK